MSCLRVVFHWAWYSARTGLSASCTGLSLPTGNGFAGIYGWMIPSFRDEHKGGGGTQAVQPENYFGKLFTGWAQTFQSRNRRQTRYQICNTGGLK